MSSFIHLKAPEQMNDSKQRKLGADILRRDKHKLFQLYLMYLDSESNVKYFIKISLDQQI